MPHTDQSTNVNLGVKVKLPSGFDMFQPQFTVLTKTIGETDSLNHRVTF